MNSTDQSNVEDLSIAAMGMSSSAAGMRNLNGSPPASGYDSYFMRTARWNTISTNRLVGVSDDFFSGIATTTEPKEVVGDSCYSF